MVEGADGVISPPPLQFATVGKSGLVVFTGPPDVRPDERFPKIRATNVQYSLDGSLLAVLDSSKDGRITVFDAHTGEVTSVIEQGGVVCMTFSPKGTHLLTWKQYTSDLQAPDGNLVVWSVAERKPLVKFIQKNYSSANWPSIRWSDDESVCTRMVANQIHFLDPTRPGTVLNRLQLDGVASYSISPGKAPYKLAAFIPEKKGNPGSIQLFDMTDLSAPVNRKSFFRAQSVEYYWNNTGTALLIQTQTDVDESGKSYYGETGLVFMSTKRTEIITLSKEGPVHDVSWSPTGREFLVIYGFMPAKATLFGLNGKPACDFGSGSRNTARWGPGARCVCIGGFGNLQGSMDFWGKDGAKKYKRIGSATAHCAAYHEWSPCGRYLLTAVLSPRIRVDNGFKIFKYTGELIGSEEAEEMFFCKWRPATFGVYPLPEIKGEAIPEKVESEPAKYRHPRSSGSVAAQLRALREADAPKTTTVKVTAARKPKPSAKKTPNTDPPGLTLASKAAKKNQRRRAKKKNTDHPQGGNQNGTPQTTEAN